MRAALLRAAVAPLAEQRFCNLAPLRFLATPGLFLALFYLGFCLKSAGILSQVRLVLVRSLPAGYPSADDAATATIHPRSFLPRVHSGWAVDRFTCGVGGPRTAAVQH